MEKQMIIVPVDGSESAKCAVKYAISQALAFKDTILLLNVQPTYDTFLAQSVLSEEEFSNLQQESATNAFEKATPYLEEHTISFTTKIRVGIPSIEICSEAKEQKARCIIVGTRGMSPIVGNALGSVSNSLVHLAPCPITLVPLNY